MKVYYDYQICTMQKYGGISRYFYDLMMTLRKNELADVQMDCLFSKNKYFEKYFGKKAVLKYLPGTTRATFLINKCYSLRRIDNDCNIIHPTYYDPYILKAKRRDRHSKIIVTVYDMIHEKFPEMFSKSDNTRKNKSKMIRNADHIIAISENTKKDILQFYPDISPDKISVIYIGSSFSPTECGDLKDQFPEKYILFVGNREQYKNFDKFIVAIKPLLLQDKQLHLVCIGGGTFNPKEMKEMEDVRDQVVQMDASDNGLTYAYANAECFVFPSLYEGFGIPTLEAFACGCPVVLSNTSSMPEVAGNAGLYFDPDDVIDMRGKIEYLLHNQAERDDLIEKGYRQLEKFNWETIARQTFECYQSVLNEEKG